MAFIFLSGPYRKANPRDLRWTAAVLAFFPIYAIGSARLGRFYLDRADSIGLSLYILVTIPVMLCLLSTWVKFVPLYISWVVAAVTWALMVLLLFTDSF
jgi:hypothetical protein